MRTAPSGYFLPSRSSTSRLYCLDQLAGGARHIPSALANAQTLGIAFFEQMSGFVCRQPTVRLSVSPSLKGSWKR